MLAKMTLAGVLRATLTTSCAALVLLGAPRAGAAQPRDAGAEAREQAFVEALRREDPAEAERYVALAAARGEAIAELERARARFGAVTPELRGPFLPQLRQAERRYAERSLAVLDLLDGRDRRTIVRYEGEVERINRVLEEHRRIRAELEKILRGE